MRPQPALPGLFSHGEEPRQTNAVNVPASSRQAYERMNVDSRMSVVWRWLGNYQRKYAITPTSAELADWANGSLGNMSIDLHILFIRRGLSDLCRRGFVEHAGKRECSVARSLALTWRVKSR